MGHNLANKIKELIENGKATIKGHNRMECLI